ncbi:MAG TPA: glycosyltransferase [Acidimicrobiales bacterium]|nr:glycosyltransferase [Acidimicrobiales bacterium]
MRFWFSFVGGTGHFLPTLPFARALVERGHDVAYGCQEAMVATVQETGLAAFATGGRTLLAPGERRPLVASDPATEERTLRNFFAGRAARERARGTHEAAWAWRPDVIVRDEVDFGAAVAAEALGLPHATIVVIAAGGFVRPDVVAEPLDDLRRDYGLGPDPGLATPDRYLTLVPVPPSFRGPGYALPPTAHCVRPAVLGARSDGELPFTTRLDRPIVYFTLGTIFHQESGDLFSRVLGGVSALAVEVIVTTGREIDPAELGKQPSNVHIERFLPLERILPGCDLVASHGGSGTVIGALAFGLPGIILPMGADQYLNAARCSALGVARALDPLTASPEEVGQLVEEVLREPAYRDAAANIRDEIGRLPSSEHGADLLERLAFERLPIVSI